MSGDRKEISHRFDATKIKRLSQRIAWETNNFEGNSTIILIDIL